jgi:ABC-type lipoprotein export system ATPase subunit
VANQDLAGLSKRQRLAYRRRSVGFIWQQTSRNLLPYLTAQQNVELPMRLADGAFGRPAAGQQGSGGGAGRRRKRATELLELLGLGDCLHRRPDQLSGGEQQRTAIAVALVNEPKVLLADEPTGELDTATAAEVFGALQQANSELGVTVLIVTHDPAVSSVVRRTVAIRDGRTSTEIHRHAVAGDDGEVAQHAVEYAVLDRAGRLQLPREMTDPLGMRDLVRLESEPDHIGVWPDRRPVSPEEAQ